MLKSTATASSACTTKHENKGSYKTDCIFPDLTNFLGDDSKEIKMHIGKININNFKKYCTDEKLVCFQYFVRLSLALYGKIMFWASLFPSKYFLVTRYLRQVNQKQFSYRKYFSIFALMWDALKVITNSFIKIQE